MLTADKLKTLTSLGPAGLTTILKQFGYKKASFKTATFIGITNGGQLCYSVTSEDPNGKGDDPVSKAFIGYDHVTNTITADM